MDTDPVFNNNNHQRNSDPAATETVAPSAPTRHSTVPSEMWLEQQFDLRPYEDDAKVKETDILSDDDEYCKSRRRAAAPSQTAELDAKMDAMEIRGVLKACAAQRGPERDAVWVRRDDFGCNSDVF